MIFGDVVASAATTGSSRRAANIRLRAMITHRHRVGGFWLRSLAQDTCSCWQFGQFAVGG